MPVFVLWHIRPIVFSTSWTCSQKLHSKVTSSPQFDVSHFALKNQTKFIIREIRSVKTLIDFACSGTVTFSANCFFLHLESALPKSTKIWVLTSVWMFCILLLKIRQKLVIWEIRSVKPLIYFPVVVLWHIWPIVFRHPKPAPKKSTQKLRPHLSLNVLHFALKNQTKISHLRNQKC